MATFSDGGSSMRLGHGAAGSIASLASLRAEGVGDMRGMLQTLLDDNEKQLSLASTLGQKFLAQRMELEERINQILDHQHDVDVANDDGDGDPEARERLQGLADAVHGWQRDNENLVAGFGVTPTAAATHAARPTPSPIVTGNNDDSQSTSGHRDSLSLSTTGDLTQPSGTTTRTAAQSSRRAKNAQHRANDVEFAFEIGSGLLTEVRRLQSLLAERDKALQDLKEEKDDLERTGDALRKMLKAQESTSEKFKEENWNLEVQLQEVRNQLTEAAGERTRLDGEVRRIGKDLSRTRDTGEQHKSEAERLNSTLEDLRTKHEADVAGMRKTAAGLQREKTDLQSALDALKADIAKKSRVVKRFGSPMTPGAGEGIGEPYTPAMLDEDDPFGAASTRRRVDQTPGDTMWGVGEPLSPEPSPSPIRAPSHPANELEALQQALAHAQRQIGTLKGSLTREKQRRIKGAAGAVEIDDEDDELAAAADAVTDNGIASTAGKGSLTPLRPGVAPRKGGSRKIFVSAGKKPTGGPGGNLLKQFNAATAARKTAPSALADDDEGVRLDSDSDPEDAGVGDTSMDPAFAQYGGLRHGASPLRQGTTRYDFESDDEDLNLDDEDDGFEHVGPAKRRRPGAGLRAGPDSRPGSLIGTPAALAAELGIGLNSPSAMSLQQLNGEPEVRIVERIVEKIVEVIKEVPVEVIREVRVEVIKEVPVEKIVEVIKEVTVEKIVEVPVEVIKEVRVEVEKIVEVPVEVIKEVSAERIVEVEVIKTVPVEVEKIVEVEKRVEVPVEVIREVPVEVIVEKEVFVEKIVERIVEVPVERIVEKEVPVERIVEVIKEVPVEKIVEVERIVEVPVEKIVTVEKIVHVPIASDSTSDLSDIGVAFPGTYARALGSRRVSGSQHTMTPVMAVAKLPASAAHRGLTSPKVPVMHDEDETEQEDGGRTETEYEDAHEMASVNIHGAGTTPSASQEFFTASDAETETDDPARHGVNTLIIERVPPAPEDRELHRERSHISNFASIERVSDNSDSEESIKASRLTRISLNSGRSPYGLGSAASGKRSRVTSVVQERVQERLPERLPERVLVDEGMQVDPQPEPQPEPQAQPVPVLLPAAEPEPAKELVEFSMQTDDLPPPSPVIPTGYQLVPIGSIPPSVTASPSGGQLFHFVPPASPTGARVHRDSGTSVVRPSIQGSLLLADEPRTRTTTGGSIASSNALALSPPAVIDKSRPPTMMLPPPPRAPPPPEKVAAAVASGSVVRRPSMVRERDAPPPRPTSPPPAALVHRATTPTFGAMLQPPASARKSSGHQQTPTVRGRASDVSFRSGQAQTHGQSQGRGQHQQFASAPAGPSMSVHGSPLQRPRSQASLASSARSSLSRASSASSRRRIVPAAAAPGGMDPSTDPAVIHAITQTMIGEFLYKYTRPLVGRSKAGEKRHRRFFWVHPYTRTLYWSAADPGSSNVAESSAKSAYIQGVKSMLDPNPSPPGLYPYSVVVSTPSREMKFTAPTKERHDIWFNALKYLLARPTPTAPPTAPPGAFNAPSVPSTPHRSRTMETDHDVFTSPKSTRSMRSAVSGSPEDDRTHNNITPKPFGTMRSQSSMGKRAGTPALEYLRWAERASSPTPGGNGGDAYEYAHGHDEDELDFELNGSGGEDAYDGLENVRACCDGKHDIGALTRAGLPHHHHHHHHQHGSSAHELQGSFERPVSPTALSTHSHQTGSHQSHGDGAGNGGTLVQFNGSREQEGSKRGWFGSRRSAKGSTQG